MRGRAQFQNIFDNEKAKIAKKDSIKSRGRSKAHHLRRNEMLLDRYFFYGRIRRLQYTDIMAVLQLEFCLATITIAEIASDNYPYLKKLQKHDATIKTLSEKWPHLNWKLSGHELLN